MSFQSISTDLIQKLLKEESKTPQGVEKLYIVPLKGQKPPKLAPRGPWRYLENPRKCASKRCGVQTWMTFDGVAYCSVHGLYYLNETVIKLTDRLEEAYKSRSRGVSVVGDLLGNYDEEDSMTDENQDVEVPEHLSSAEPGNQSEQEVEEIRTEEVADESDQPKPDPSP